MKGAAMKLFCIDPTGLSNKRFFVEADNLRDAAQAGADVIGVMVVNMLPQRDSKSVDYLMGVLGNGKTYAVFDAADLQVEWRS
jgi:hypothetical protein